MSEHAWSQEHIAASIAGGLGAAESERLQKHLRECPACASALEASRRFDQRLASLFEIARPRPDLEDRALQAFRRGPEHKPLRAGEVWGTRMAIAAGVAAVLTAGGFVGTHLDRLPGPENVGWQFAKRSTGPESVPTESVPDKDLTNEDLGFQSNLEGALPYLDRTDKQTVDAVVIQDNLGQPNAPEQRGRTDRGTERYHERDIKLNEGDAGLGLPPLTGQNGKVASNHAQADTYTRYVKNIDSMWLLSPANPYYAGGYTAPGNFALGDRGDKENMFRFGTNMASSEPGASQSKAPPVYQPPGSSSSTADRPVATPLDSAPVQKAPAQKPGADVPDAIAKSASVSPEVAGRNIVIRTGEMEFIIDSFDAAAATVTKLVKDIKGGFVATINSEKLSNGKMKGTVTVRVPPDQLDGLLLDLRRELGKGGEITGSRIGSQDVTKQYTDLESRLKAARTMEQRLLQIIKEGGKGEIKGLIEAERELGNWQTKIEEYEGELRYYANRVALSTLTITLTEREIQAAAGITESERVQAGVEVEDVDQAYLKLLAAVAEAKGRITKSEMKQQSAGLFSATVNFEAAADAAGPLRDRLRQLGRIARMDTDRFQRPEGAVTKNAKIERGDALFFVQLYNLANIAPQEVAVLQAAVPDVPAAFRSLREAVAKAKGRELLAQLNKQEQQNFTAQFDFEVPRSEEPTLRAAIETLGEVVSRQATRAPDSGNVTDAKVMIRASLIAVNQIKPRQKEILTLEVADVDQSRVLFEAEVEKVYGREIDSQFTRDRSGRLTAKLVFETPYAAATGLVERFKSAGAVRVFQSTRDPQAPEGKYATARIEVTLTNADRIVAADEGLWPQTRQGLMYSATVLLTSVKWAVFGLCVVLPWAVIGYLCIRIIRSLLRSNRSNTPPTTST